MVVFNVYTTSELDVERVRARSFLKWCLNVEELARLRWYVWVNGGLTKVLKEQNWVGWGLFLVIE